MKELSSSISAIRVFCVLLDHSSIDIRLLTSASDLSVWNTFVQEHPCGSVWQSPEWKRYQEALGRDARVYAAFEGQQLVAAALVMIDRTAGNLATWEIPRGPIGENASNLARHIAEDARRERALVLRLSPFTPLSLNGSGPSDGHSQPEATRMLDLMLDDNALLAQMKPKGRYNIRLAQRHDIEVRDSDDIEAFHALLKRTSQRDRFSIHAASHYKAFLEHLPGGFLLLAYHRNDEPIAGLMGAIWDNTGMYYYGASDERHRALMAPYLLQWEAIKLCKARGCTRYDLLGIAPIGSDSTHPWAGISSFKEKFGGTVIEYPQEQQVMIRPILWRLLQVKRKILG